MNFGTKLALWDLLFGTFYLPEGRKPTGDGADSLLKCTAKCRTFVPGRATMARSVHSKETVDRELKKERIELRVAPSAKLLIQRAMEVSGLTAGDLAYEGARRVLAEHERMVLTGADRDAFLAAVLEPPEPTERLVAALKRHRAMLG
jgi:uncharacterized protein (DUF1778 family)